MIYVASATEGRQYVGLTAEDMTILSQGGIVSTRGLAIFAGPSNEFMVHQLEGRAIINHSTAHALLMELRHRQRTP